MSHSPKENKILIALMTAIFMLICCVGSLVMTSCSASISINAPEDEDGAVYEYINTQYVPDIGYVYKIRNIESGKILTVCKSSSGHLLLLEVFEEPLEEEDATR